MIELLRMLAPYHDYGWFIALIAWAAALVLWQRTLRNERGWAWLPWAAAPGAAAALVELISFAWPAVSLRAWARLLPEDLLLGTLSAVTVAGWVWALPVRGSLRACASILILSAAGLRFVVPVAGGAAIAGAGLLAAGALAVSLDMSGRAKWGLWSAAVGLWFASAGPLADFGLQSRRIVTFGEWSPVWSGVQAAVALIAMVSVLVPWFVRGERGREWRPFLAVCVLWLIFGLGLGAAMSAGARNNFEAQALARVHMAAALMDKAALIELLSPEFRLTEISTLARPGDGSVMRHSRVPRLQIAAGATVQRELALIGRAGAVRGFFATFQTARAGWLVTFTPQGYSNNPKNQNKLSDRVGLASPTSEDLLDWSEIRGRFMPPLVEGSGRANEAVYARAPVVSEGLMLGWLWVEFPRRQWIAAQVQSRLQAFAIVGLGLGLAALLALQRVHTREREAARADAAAAAQADRLKTSFLAKVSHELRTPIQSVLGYGELLQSAISDPVSRRHLAALREHGELMRRLVNDLLDLSAIHAGAFRLVARPLELIELIRHTVENLRPRAEAKSLTLSLVVEPNVPAWVELDGERVNQVLINLASNAIKFTDRGGVEVILQAGPQPGDVTLLVRDTGPGISAAELSRLFQPFGRLDATADKEGTGLGLALTAGLCRSMGGDVSVASLPGVGATFLAWFRAPVCAAPDDVAADERAESMLAGRRVLIADDNGLVRELFTASLQAAGAQCVAVEDGERALVTALEGGFDALVLDLSMPRLDGLEVTRRFRAAEGTARIIGVSAHAGEIEREQALAVGMDVFLVKPVGLEVLMRAIVPRPVAHIAVNASDAALIRRLQEQFRSLAAKEGAALAQAVAHEDFSAAYARAHHLMNSAAVVRDDPLFEACVQVETAARSRDAIALRSSWIVCAAALTPWTKAAASVNFLSAQQP